MYISLKKRYLEMEDLTEYDFANRWFVSWSHWQTALKTAFIRKEVEQWREELEVKYRAKGLRSIIDSAEKGNYNAAKCLLDKGWLPKRGRPTKAEIEGEKRKAAQIKDELDEDLERIGLQLVK